MALRGLSSPPPSAPPSWTPPPQETLEKLSRPCGRVIAELRRVMTHVYQAIHAALLPVRLHDLPRFIDVFLEHVGRRNEKKRPKQTERFLGRLDSTPSAPPPPQANASVCVLARASPYIA
jgi:hypothetical protein